MLTFCQYVLAQNDSIINLKEVIVSDLQLKNFSNTQKIIYLKDSIINSNSSSLTTLLNYNSNIYFKENGLGMVSSPSFRGTTAQQTAVIWNGININSQLNGQTDFNTISGKSFDNIAVRSGGGSTLYGSSAIGGSIHLNNDLEFNERTFNFLDLNYGSYNTFGLNYKLKTSTQKLSSQIVISRNSSDNDYKYLGTNSKNENGQFHNTSLNIDFGYKFSPKNIIKFYGQTFNSERHFSLFNASDTKTKYEDFNTRNLLEWEHLSQKFSSRLKFAFLTEQYKYFEGLNTTNFYYGKVETLVAKYDLSFNLNKKLKINSVFDFNQNKGNGSNINNQTRTITAANLFLHHKVTSDFEYEITTRKEVTTNYKSPFLFSFGMKYTPTSFYKIRINGSKNFRVPTFNDLYWQGSGNLDLKPESSIQGEISNEFSINNFSISATFFKIDIKDMIRWLPGNGGIFSPTNTNAVAIVGVETGLGWQKKINKINLLFNANYTYTKSENKETGKQLIYVPFHKITFSGSLSFKKFTIGFQHLFNGEVFTQSDNNPQKIIKSHNVSNLIMDYYWSKKRNHKIGFKVLNLWNEKYENVENRPFPGTNFNFNLTFNI